MNWFTTLITVTACINFLLLIVMVFLERRKLQTIIAWLTVLTFLPIFGFLLYIWAEHKNKANDKEEGHF